MKNLNVFSIKPKIDNELCSWKKKKQTDLMTDIFKSIKLRKQ